MRLRSTPQGVIVHDAEGDRWVSLARAIALAGAGSLPAESEVSMLALLGAGPAGEQAVASLLSGVSGDDGVAADPAQAGLPFRARSLRAFMVFESHVIASSRALVERFFPAPVAKLMHGFEGLTRRTFPPLKPNAQFHERPPFYVGAHTAMLADGQPIWWPSHTEFLDFELELACVLARPLSDATPDQARAAIGGWLVLNDWSARDVQAEDARHNPFGPVVKAKSFANSIGCDVVTPGEFGNWRDATGRVTVDGELWCEGGTADSAWDIGEMIAHASEGELLGAGDVISTGTMPGCCGLELDRWVKPGETVRLEIEGIGSLSTPISAEATPAGVLGGQ